MGGLEGVKKAGPDAAPPLSMPLAEWPGRSGGDALNSREAPYPLRSHDYPLKENKEKCQGKGEGLDGLAGSASRQSPLRFPGAPGQRGLRPVFLMTARKTGIARS